MKFLVAPGATPIEDLSHLKVPVLMQSELDALEFDNIYKAEQAYFKRRKFKDTSWFHPAFLKKIHADMFGEVWEWGGKYRTQSVLPIGVEPYLIPLMLLELAQDVRYWLDHPNGMNLIEIAGRIHHRLVWIHPFPNGNGRFGRFVSDLFLFSYRCVLPTWPGGMHREGAHRSEYLTVLCEADKGDFRAFVAYLQKLGAKVPHATV